MQHYNQNTQKAKDKQYIGSVTILISVAAVPSNVETTLTGIWSPSAFVFIVLATTGEADDLGTTIVCISAAETGATETGLDTTPSTLEDEVSALGVDSTTRGETKAVVQLLTNIPCVSSTEAFSTCWRANLIPKAEKTGEK